MEGKIVWILYDYVFSFMWNIETCDLRFYFCKLIIWDHFGFKVNKASKLRSCKWSYERYNCSHRSPVHYLDWLSWKCAELWVNYSAQFFSVFTLVCHNKQLGVELMWHDCSNSLEAFHACYTSSFFFVFPKVFYLSKNYSQAGTTMSRCLKSRPSSYFGCFL